MPAAKKPATYECYLVISPCGQETVLSNLQDAKDHAIEEADDQDGTSEVFGCTKVGEAEARQVVWKDTK